jgi:hypothetical protein
LAVALPRDEFVICITREAEFEIPPIKKPELKEFIEATIEQCLISTDVFFGFNDNSLSPTEQRVGGFDIGRFASPEEYEFIVQQRTPLKHRHLVKNLKTGLYKDEADISIAARALHSVVLSLDSKKGPLNAAYQQGGKVVFLTHFDPKVVSLATFIRTKLTEQGNNHHGR